MSLRDVLSEMPSFAEASAMLLETIADLRHDKRGVPHADALRAAADQAERWAARARALARLLTS